MIRLFRCIQNLIVMYQISIFIGFRGVETQLLYSGVFSYIRRGSARQIKGVFTDIHAAFWPHHIFYKISLLTDHGPPSGLVPSDRSIVKTDLKLTIVVLIFVDFIR